MSVSRRSKKVVFILIGLIGFGLYSFFIEPNWIQVTHIAIKGPVKTPIRIALLSDIHTKGWGAREEKLISLLEQEKPDLIVIAGDSITDKTSYKEVKDVLSKLRAPFGVVLVRGNWEHWKPFADELDAYKLSGVTFLNNSSKQVRDDFWVIGVDDSYAGNPKLNEAVGGVPENVFRLGLFHAPEFYDVSSKEFTLALAGHTHGGQVRVPFWGPLYLPPHSGNYDIGLYEKEISKMYVGRGIGTSILNVRFNCRPELPIITVSPI